jgi:2-desacetyl-2-hydroxyethyl bacteriochlorophyllide A dehydrogenase
LKAVLKSKPGVGFEYREDVERPKIGPDQVLVKVKATGICGSDLHLYRGEVTSTALPELPIPFVPGHEFAGEIAELGSSSSRFKVGDRVSAELMVSCGHCYYCNTGQRVYCTSLREIGADMNGSYAEYVAVPEQNLHRVPDALPWEDAALCDCLSSALHPFELLSGEIITNMAILGAGPIGLAGVQVAKTLGAKRVISIDVIPERLELAKRLGADHIVNASELDMVKEVQKFTDGLGADVVMEMAGSPNTISASIDMVRKNGEIVWMGIHLDPILLRQFLVMAKAINIHGCFDYTWLTFERAIHLMTSGRVKMKPFVTHILPLSEVSKAFDLLTKKEAIKVVMKP